MTFKHYLLNVLILILFGWSVTAYFNASMEIKNAINSSSSDEFAFTLDLLPLILLLVVGIPAGIVFTRRQRKNNKGWIAALFLPDEFREQDEREKAITSKATRNSYISIMIAAPCLAILMVFQPFVSDYFSAYPIVIILLLPFIQLTVFYLSLRKKSL